MRNLIKFFGVIAILAFLSSSVNAQSQSDVESGNFSLPSYKEMYGWSSYGDDKSCTYKFSDDTEGILWYFADCKKYGFRSAGIHFKYPSQSKAIKALYAFKKYGYHMDGNVNCND